MKQTSKIRLKISNTLHTPVYTAIRDSCFRVHINMFLFRHTRYAIEDEIDAEFRSMHNIEFSIV